LALKANSKKWFTISGIGVVITLLFFLAYVIKPKIIEQLNDLYFDLMQRQYSREYNPDVPVRIIDIDDESILRIGQWPWPRTQMTELNRRLGEVGAAVVAYDIVFSESDRTSPENMISVLKKNPAAKGEFYNIAALRSHDKIFAESFDYTNVVTGFFLVNKPTDSLPRSPHGFAFSGSSPQARINNYAGALHALPMLEKKAAGIGHASFIPDRDGVIRQAPLLGRIDDRLFPSLSMEALRVPQGANNFIVKSANASGELGNIDLKHPEMASLKVGAFEIPTMPNGDMVIHYTQPHPERYIPAWKIFSDEAQDQDWQDKIAGHIVFIGTGAEGLKDLRATPIRGGEPGVLVHAQIVEQILGDQFLYRPYWARTIEMLGIILLGFILAFSLPRLTAVRGVIMILFMINIIGAASIYAFTNFNYILEPVYPLLAVSSLYVISTLASFYMTENERSRIRNAFSMYLSPTMVKRVSEDPGLLSLGGEERDLSVMFVDVRSFSKISETMRPQDITLFLNKFLTPMTDIIQEMDGTIDKYIGDAIVAFWNAPLDDDDHQRKAAKTILKMQSSLADLNAEYRNQNEFKWPDSVKMGLGVNTGICCVGNLGSEQRFSYSMIGDAANLASRIEGLTKQYGVSNLVGHTTVQASQDLAYIEADFVEVVGRVNPEHIYILLGDEKTASSADFKKFYKKHEAFIVAYRGQKWKKALALAKTLEDDATAYDIHDYYKIMSVRIKAYQANPPPTDWDGVYKATEK